MLIARLSILYALLFLINVQNKAQEKSARFLKLEKKGRYQPGYVIENDSTIINGLLVLDKISSDNYYKSIDFINYEGVRSRYYSFQLKAFGFENNYFEPEKNVFIRMASPGGVSARYKELVKSVDYELGYLINRENRKLPGLIRKYSDYDSYFISIEYVGENGVSRNFSASDINGFSVDSLEFLSFNDVFYQIIQRGSMYNLLRAVAFVSNSFVDANGISYGGASRKVEKRYLLDNENEELHKVSKKNLISVAQSLLSNCPNLLKGIQDQRYSYTELREIMKEYELCDKQ